MNFFAGPYGQPQQPGVVVAQPMVTQVKNQSQTVGLVAGSIAFGWCTFIFLISLMCWWALPCSIVGLVLGFTVSLRTNTTRTMLKVAENP